MNVDLHCHSNASDGALDPAEVVRRAAAQGVALLALTDHDQLAGLAEARAAAGDAGIEFVDGVEISTTWRGSSVHVLGLRIDPRHEPLGRALAAVRAGRIERAKQMARDLSAAGIGGSFDGAMRHAQRPEMIGRTHFARYLVEAGLARDIKAVFKRFLVPGKPGYVEHRWAGLAEAVRWIREAGGDAVLAHPGRYPFSAAAMRELIAEFRSYGGVALEVACGSHTPEQCREYGTLAAHLGLKASRGSDFHAPGEGAELGGAPALDARLSPVWSGWHHAPVGTVREH
jgi:hypothetical protein